MLLVTRPNHDNATNYLYYWSEQVINEANKKKVKVLDLAGDKSNKKDFLSYIRKHNPKLLFLNGHGSDDSICGYDDQILIDCSDNFIEFKNSIIVSRSCRSAKLLGKKLVENGLEAFIGYVNNYVVKVSKKKITDPLNDKIASLYLEPSNMIVKVLLKGCTVMEADKRSKKMLLANLGKVFASNSNDKDDIARWLYHDYCSQTIIGDINAKI